MGGIGNGTSGVKASGKWNGDWSVGLGFRVCGGGLLVVGEGAAEGAGKWNGRV